MSKMDAAAPDYEHTYGFDDFVVETMRRRNAQANAGYLLPHLQPGHRLLDFGCGIGTISVGLADAVSPGEMHGIAMIESRVEMAREFATEGGHDNAEFHVFELGPLPFEDGYFDVAHCHNILMSFPDPQVVLRELRRVLKPSGIIGCREMMLDASFSFPDDDGVLARSWEIFTDLLDVNFRQARVGKELKWLMLESGFEDVWMSADFDVYSEPEDIEFIRDVFLRWFFSEGTMTSAIEYGAATKDLWDRIKDYYYNVWLKDPAAMIAMAHGVALARKPYE